MLNCLIMVYDLDRRDFIRNGIGLVGGLGFGGLYAEEPKDSKGKLESKSDFIVTEEDFGYFGETFGLEYPPSKYKNQRVIKWDGPLEIYVHGRKTESDMKAIRKMIRHSKDVGLDEARRYEKN